MADGPDKDERQTPQPLCRAVGSINKASDGLMALHAKWQEEMFYRRHRTSFITSWYTGLFVALIGGLLAGVDSLTPLQATVTWALIAAVWLITVMYFIYSICNHWFAKKMLEQCERSIVVQDKSLWDRQDAMMENVHSSRKKPSRREPFLARIPQIALFSVTMKL